MAPVSMRARPTSTIALTIAAVPSSPTRNGSTGTAAPEAKNAKLDSAAPQSGAHDFVFVAVILPRLHGADGVIAAQDCIGLQARLVGGVAAGPVDEGELVSVEVKARQDGVRVGDVRR